MDIAPTEISFAPPVAGRSSSSAAADDSSPNSFTVRATIFPDISAMFQRRPNWNLTIERGTPRVENWLALSEALAQPLKAKWTATGGLARNIQAVPLPQPPPPP